MTKEAYTTPRHLHQWMEDRKNAFPHRILTHRGTPEPENVSPEVLGCHFCNVPVSEAESYVPLSLWLFPTVEGRNKFIEVYGPKPYQSGEPDGWAEAV